MIQALLLVAAGAAYVAKTRSTKTLVDIRTVCLPKMREAQENLFKDLERLNANHNEKHKSLKPLDILTDFIRNEALKNPDPHSYIDDAVETEFTRAIHYKGLIKRIGLYNRVLVMESELQQIEKVQLLEWLDIHIENINQLLIGLYFKRDSVSYAECINLIKKCLASSMSYEEKMAHIQTIEKLINFIEDLIAQYLNLVIETVKNHAINDTALQTELENKIYLLQITVKQFSSLQHQENIQNNKNAIQELQAKIEDNIDAAELPSLKAQLAKNRSTLLITSMELYLLDLLKNEFFTPARADTFLRNAILHCYVPLLDKFQKYHDIKFPDDDINIHPCETIIPKEIVSGIDHSVRLFKVPFPNQANIFNGCINEEGVEISPVLDQTRLLTASMARSVTNSTTDTIVTKQPPPIPKRPLKFQNNKLTNYM